jgi:hypothetical protein
MAGYMTLLLAIYHLVYLKFDDLYAQYIYIYMQKRNLFFFMVTFVTYNVLKVIFNLSFN